MSRGLFTRAHPVRLAVGVGFAALVAVGAGCGEPPLVTFEVDQPSLFEFNPLAGAVTEYTLRTTDGLLLASSNAQGKRLELGKLQTFMNPRDLQLQILSGAELRGMGRFRDVRLQPGRSGQYEAAVRKPLVFVGSALPAEGGLLDPDAAQILDTTASFNDLAHPASGNNGVESLPARTSSTAATWDARYVMAGRNRAIALYNTSTGKIDGEIAISFTPSRLVVAPRDVAMAALRVDAPTRGAVALFPDLEAVRSDPAAQEPIVIDLPDMAPRAAVFSADGEHLYVLLGSPDEMDPCNLGRQVNPSDVLVLRRDGTEVKRWSLGTFAADIAVDATGRDLDIVLSLSTQNSVIALKPDSPEDDLQTEPLLTAICPSAVRIVGDELFVVTSARDAVDTDFFRLERIELSGDRLRSSVSFAAPTYEVPLGLPTDDGRVAFQQRFFANSIFGYELAVTPDGTRAVFATRARFVQTDTLLNLFQEVDCRVTIDVAEYGVYFMDVRAGAAFYTTRSQLISGDPLNCLTVCEFTTFPQGVLFDLECAPPEGVADRAAGITMLFGG